MSASGDSHTRLRKNPERTCRTVAQSLEDWKRSAKQDTTLSNSKEPNEHHDSQKLVLQNKTRGRVKKPVCQQPKDKQTSPSCSANGHLSPTVPPQTTECLQKTPKRCKRGRKRTRKKPSDKRNASSKDAKEKLSNILDTCSSFAKTEEMTQKVRQVRCSKRTEPRTPTKTTLYTGSQRDASTLPHVSELTPESGQRRGRWLRALSSTPVRAAGGSTVPLRCPDTNGRQNEPELSPVKNISTDALPKQRSRGRKPQDPDKPAAQQKKRKSARDKCAAAPAKRSRKKDKAETDPQNQPTHRVRPRFELQDSEVNDPGLPDTEQNMSSDLSIELSLREEPDAISHSLSLQEEEEEEEEEDEEELPSFLQQTSHKPSSIREGQCVWCKHRKYPFWPAMVKSVNHKNKKASIVYIDKLLFDKKSIRNVFTVSLRTLKPFDCEEQDQFVDVGKERFGALFTWSLELISDYRIRIGCGSFQGSLIEYFTNDISSPVRMRYPHDSSELAFPSQQLLNEERGTEGESAGEPEGEQNKWPDQVHSVKVLPDRTQAARNRANQRLVDFIVKKRGVEDRLMAVIRGEEHSKWLQALNSCNRSVVDVYLEDDKQVDKVYRYLEKLFQSASKTSTGLEITDRIQFILDVLLPEAIIHAIAGVDRLTLDKAEEKYRRGPCHSNRERQEFDMMIEQQMKLKAVTGRP